MASKGPANYWGDTRPDKEDLIKVLTAGVDGAIEYRLSLIPSKWGGEAQEEEKGMIQRRMAKMRAEMQHKSDAQRAWGFKTGEVSKI